MPEQVVDANQGQLENQADVNAKIDGELDKIFPSGTPAESSSAKPAASTEGGSKEAVEDTTSLKSDTASKDEPDVPTRYDKDPAWQRLLKQRNDAIAKAESLSKTPQTNPEFEKKFGIIDELTKSPRVLRAVMEEKGYTPQAIDSKLKELGFQVETRPADFNKRVTSRLASEGIDVSGMPADAQALVKDIIAINKAVFSEMANEILPKELEPIKQHVERVEADRAGERAVHEIKGIVKDMNKKANAELISYEIDIEPALGKFMDENPNATRDDVIRHARELSTDLTIERVQTKGKKTEIDNKKKDLRTPVAGTSVRQASKLPQQKKGQTDSDFIGDLLDSIGMKD